MFLLNMMNQRLPADLNVATDFARPNDHLTGEWFGYRDFVVHGMIPIAFPLGR